MHEDTVDRERMTPTRPASRRQVLKLMIGMGFMFGFQSGALGKPPRVFRIGFLGYAARTAPDAAPFLDAFEDGLRACGYTPGVDVLIDYRANEGVQKRLDDDALDLARSHVDVIVTMGNWYVASARRATTSIPIVMITGVEPVRSGLIASLGHPGGNITGLTYDAGPEMHAKPLQYLKDVRPSLSSIVILRQPSRIWAEAEAVARESAHALQLSIDFVDVANDVDVLPAFATIKKLRAEAVLCWCYDIPTREQVAAYSLRMGLPSASTVSLYAQEGGLIGFGPDPTDLFRRSARYVDNILKGAMPADLPVEQPVRFELVVNRTTARALGIAPSQPVLLRADRVVD